ncbi:hypothetical protein XENOCAPTIV_006275 [Xenoophorus captivus]|uniref:Uncharacterized protein n=1 Tax=Xenoophorus captivus TaxID=1517983 RepID=A0ABV0R790_9TELE
MRLFFLSQFLQPNIRVVAISCHRSADSTRLAVTDPSMCRKIIELIKTNVPGRKTRRDLNSSPSTEEEFNKINKEIWKIQTSRDQPTLGQNTENNTDKSKINTQNVNINRHKMTK